MIICLIAHSGCKIDVIRYMTQLCLIEQVLISDISLIVIKICECEKYEIFQNPLIYKQLYL